SCKRGVMLLVAEILLHQRSLPGPGIDAGAILALGGVVAGEIAAVDLADDGRTRFEVAQVEVIGNFELGAVDLGVGGLALHLLATECERHVSSPFVLGRAWSQSDLEIALPAGSGPGADVLAGRTGNG